MLVIDFNVVLFVILTTEHHDIAIILIKMLLIAKSINKAILELKHLRVDIVTASDVVQLYVLCKK